MTRPTVLDTPAEVEAIMRSLPARRRPGGADDWHGCVHFVITGADKPEWTVRVDPEACTVDEGLHGEPSCVVTMPAKTFVGVETGKKNPMAAFLRGRIKVTNVGQIRRYEKAFYKLYDLPDSSPPPEDRAG